MQKTGRNDPCPCGSGLKYKKCCLNKQISTSTYSADERESILVKIEKFISEIDPEEKEIAREEFCGEFKDDYEKLENNYVKVISEEAFNFWLFFDLSLEDKSFIVDHFLKSNPALTRGEKRYLEQARASCMKLYEIAAVIPGSSLTLTDLSNKNTIEVKEKLGSQQRKKFDIIAARILPAGVSGRPEIDGGFFSLPRMQLHRIQKTVQDYRSLLIKESPQIDETGIYKIILPVFYQCWLHAHIAPIIPKITTTDGEDFLFCEAIFDILDRDRLITALDHSSALAAGEKKDSWNWLLSDREKGGKRQIGVFSLQGDKLHFETFSLERVEKAKKFINRIAPGAVNFRLTSQQTPEQAISLMQKRGTRDLHQDMPEAPREEMEILEEETKKANMEYYIKWLDMEIPALDGITPRQAAKSPEMRQRLVELLKDLIHGYEMALSMGNPGFDPFWIWSELDLEEEWKAMIKPGVAQMTGYEAMLADYPELCNIAIEVANRRRKMPDFDESTVITDTYLESDIDFQRFTDLEAKNAYRDGFSMDDSVNHAHFMATHIQYLSNFELHHRKTFWVDETLSWMLGNTNLDITGDTLRLPFASFALVFTDRMTLEIAEALLSKDPTCKLRGTMLQITTVFIAEIYRDGMHGLQLAFLFDALDGRGPYLLVREVVLNPETEIEKIVESHFPDIDTEALEPIFKLRSLKKLIKLVINAILYATSADVEIENRTRPAAEKPDKSKVSGAVDRKLLRREEVFFLPGKITISRLREMQKVERSPSGRHLMTRFMVRGHWRKPNPSWNEQHLRWIKPYWKGPDLAAIIEREYRLKP